MALSFNVPSSPHTVYTVSVDGTTYQFTFRWGARAQLWTMDIHTLAGEVIVLNAALVLGVPLLRRGITNSPEGDLRVFSNTNSDVPPKRFNIGPNKDYELIYSTKAEVDSAN